MTSQFDYLLFLARNCHFNEMDYLCWNSTINYHHSEEDICLVEEFNNNYIIQWNQLTYVHIIVLLDFTVINITLKKFIKILQNLSYCYYIDDNFNSSSLVWNIHDQLNLLKNNDNELDI